VACCSFNVPRRSRRQGLTLSETTAVATAVAGLAVGQQHRLIPLSKLRRSNRTLASEAGRLAAGSGWLPAMLCAPSASERAEAALHIDTSSADEDSESGQE